MCPRQTCPPDGKDPSGTTWSQDSHIISENFGPRWSSQTDFWRWQYDIHCWFRPAASFYINPVYISSKLVEFNTFDCGIVFPEYVMGKLPAKLHAYSTIIFGSWMCNTSNCHFKNCKFLPLAKGFPPVVHRWTLMELWITFPTSGQVLAYWNCHGHRSDAIESQYGFSRRH